MRTRVTLSLMLCAFVLAAPCAAQIAVPARTNAPDNPVNLEVKDTPLSQVLEMLLNNSGVSYTIDPAVSDIKVNAVLKNIPLEMAIKQIAKAAGIVYRIDSGTYLFSARPNVFEGPAVTPDSSGGCVLGIPLNYLDPSDVIPILTASQVQVVSSSTSSITFRGTEESANRAANTVAQLDTPDALPRPVRVKLTVTVDTGDGKVRKLITENVGAEGMPMRLEIGTLQPVQSQAKPGATKPSTQWTAELVYADLTPIVVDMTGDPEKPEYSISLTGRGMISGLKPAGIQKNFDVATSILWKPGAKSGSCITAGSVDYNGRQVSFEISASASLDEGRVRRPPGQGPGPYQEPRGYGYPAGGYDPAMGGYPSPPVPMPTPTQQPQPPAMPKGR